MTTSSSTGGFTIVELMVTLAVAAILMGFAVPAFNDFVRQRTMSSRINDFVLAVNYARSEAVRRGEEVRVWALGGDGDNEWGEGYQVVTVNDPEVLREFAAFDDATLDASGALDGRFSLTFNSRGLLIPQGAGAVALCSTVAGVDPGRVVNFSPLGRPDVEEQPCNP